MLWWRESGVKRCICPHSQVWCQIAWHLMFSSFALASFLPSSERVKETLSGVFLREPWACTVLARELCNHFSSTKPEHQPCWKLWSVSSGSVMGKTLFRSLRSDLVTSTASHLKNILELRFLSNVRGRWKCPCVGAEVSLNGVVIWSSCLWHFVFLSSSTSLLAHVALLEGWLAGSSCGCV